MSEERPGQGPLERQVRPAAYRVKLAACESGMSHAYAESEQLLAFLDAPLEMLYDQAAIAAAVAAERGRWRAEVETMAEEADHKFTLDGTTAHWLRVLRVRVCGPNAKLKGGPV